MSQADSPTPLAQAKAARGRARVGLVACARVRGNETLAVVVRGGELPTVIAAERIVAGDREAALSALLVKHGARRLVRIAPSRECVARVVSMPATHQADLRGALALVLEAESPAAALSHRRAGVLLGPSPASESTRDALLTAWLGKGESARDATDGGDSPVTWTTPLAALLALHTDAAGSVPSRLVYAPADEGAATVLVRGQERTVARVVLESPGDGGYWRAMVGRIVRETERAAGGRSPEIADWDDAESDALGVERFAGGKGLAGRVAGCGTGEAWWQSFGLCVGGALAALDQREAEAGGLGACAGLLATPPRIRKHPLVAGGEWLGTGNRGWVVGAACVALMLLVPWGVALARHDSVTRRAQQLDAANAKAKDIELKAAMYRQLEGARWPMTKLLGDIAQAAPIGLTVESLRMTLDQTAGDGVVTIEGVAETQSLATEFQSRLTETRLFRNVKASRVEAKEGAVEFNISASVSSPHSPSKISEDFVAQPLAVRMHGAGASNQVPPKGAVKTVQASGTRGGARGDQSASSPRSGGGESASRRPSGGSSDGPPQALTDEDIGKMDGGQALKAWADRRKYLTANAKLDPEVKRRLEDEVTKLFAHRSKLTASKDGSPKNGAPRDGAPKDGSSKGDAK
jgi:hypothetical protein